MRVTIVNQYYWPHHSATSQLMTELAEALVQRGHEIRVVAAQTGPDSDGSNGPGARPARHEIRNGVRIDRVPATAFGKKTIAHRLADYGSFYGGALLTMLMSGPSPDVILALTTPPLIAVPALAAARARGAALVSLVQDVYPEIAVALGAIPARSPLTTGWRKAAQLSLKASDGIIVLSEAMRRRILPYGLDNSRIHTIPNWALAEMLGTPEPRENTFRQRHNLSGQFIVTYSGNMGAGHAFTTVLDAAKRMATMRPEMRFLFIGAGMRRAEIEAGATERGLTNTQFLPYQPLETLPLSLGAADMHLVTMRAGIDGLLMPSKLYGILAAARPVLFVGPESSEIAAVIKTYDCGAAIALGDVDGLAQCLADWADDPERARAAGDRGRALVEPGGALHRERSVDGYETVLAEACSARQKRRAFFSKPRRSRPVRPAAKPGQVA